MEPKSTHKLSKLQGYLLTVFLISVFMTAVMSLGMLLAKANSHTNLLKAWGKDFVLGCAIAIPAGYILVPLIQRLVDAITDAEIHPHQKLKLKR